MCVGGEWVEVYLYTYVHMYIYVCDAFFHSNNV